MSEKRRGLLYNEDEGSMVFHPHPYPMTLEQYYDCVDQLVGTQVDTYVRCTGSPSRPSEAEMLRERADLIEKGTYKWRCVHNYGHLMDLGIDPAVALLDRATARGMKAIASVRMSDAHFSYGVVPPDVAPYACKFWLEHPECRIDPTIDTSKVLRDTPAWRRVLFDFSHPEVQQYVMDWIDDILQRANADGLELDFMRHPYFFDADEAPRKLDVMTGFVKRIRKRVDEVAQAKGRPMELGVLVPSSPKAGRSIGIDGIAWMQERLVDYVVPKHYINFVMDIPLEEYVEAAAGTGIEVYACLENWPSGDAAERPIESFRGAAAHYWQVGVDGIYVYNYFNHRPHPLSKVEREILQEIGDADLLMRKDKRYTMMSTPNRREGEDYQLPLEISGRHSVRFVLGDEEVPPDQWPFRANALQLRFEGLVVEDDVLEFELNGAPVPPDGVRWLFDVEWYDFRELELSLPGGTPLRKGENELVVTLKQRCPGVTNPLRLTDLEVFIRYDQRAY